MGYHTCYNEEDLHQLHKDWTQEPKKLESMQKILSLVPEDVESVLDYGCGTGRYSQHFKNYVGFDRNPYCIEFAKKTYPDKLFSTKFPRRKFDLVLVISVIQYQPEAELETFIAEIMSKSSKYVLIQTWDEDCESKTVGSFKGGVAHRRHKETYFQLLSKHGTVERFLIDEDNKAVYLIKLEK